MDSIILLWIAQGLSLLLIAALGVVVFALTRQVGVLHERITPVGALMTHHGPNVGDFAQPFEVNTVEGVQRRIGGQRADGKRTLVMFASPTCPVCKKLMPAAMALARDERDLLELVIVSDGPMADHEAFRKALRLDGVDYVVSADIGIKYNIGRLPFGLLLNSEGKVLSKGLTNTREHIESLLNVEDLGVASLQAYRARNAS